MIDHRLLHRMQRLAISEVLDRDELRAVELAQEQDAGIDRLAGQLAATEPRQHDRAGAAITLGATFLRTRGALVLAQPVEHSGARREAVERDLAPAKPEAQRVTAFRRHLLQSHRRSSKTTP